MNEKQIRAIQKASISNFNNDALDCIAIMKDRLKPNEWEDILRAVLCAKDEEDAEKAILDFYNDCY